MTRGTLAASSLGLSRLLSSVPLPSSGSMPCASSSLLWNFVPIAMIRVSPSAHESRANCEHEFLGQNGVFLDPMGQPWVAFSQTPPLRGVLWGVVLDTFWLSCVIFAKYENRAPIAARAQLCPVRDWSGQMRKKRGYPSPPSPPLRPFPPP